MTNKELYDLSIKLHSLTIFKSLKDNDVISTLMKYLDVKESSEIENVGKLVELYSEFVSGLFAQGDGNLANYIKTIVLDDENVYVKLVGLKKNISKSMKTCLDRELDILQKVATLTPEKLREGLDWEDFLPGWDIEEINLKEDYFNRMENISKFGYGMYAKYHMFYIDNSAQIVPVKNPDPILLSDLIDYKNEQQIILDNTQALLNDKPASNVLLTGDAGTGKSSTIKAICNELYKEGLRILEVRKEQLREIPAILDELTINPLKFIIFIDDLSFQKDDDNYSALKAILEGSVSAKSKNVVIYATSNRRHLIKEKFSDREGDDIHANDTMQESISLSERFGIQITFSKPDKKTYLEIVKHLADQNGITYNIDILNKEAEKFALSRGGRSARAAKQLIDLALSGTIKFN